LGRYIAAAIGGLIGLALFIAALVMGAAALDRGLSRWMQDSALGAAFAMATLLLLGLAAILVAYACLRRRRRVPAASAAAAIPADLGQAASDFAKRNPWMAVAAAFAAGFLASGSKTTEQLLAEILKQAQRE
jgi:hypothetical protein